MSSELVLPANVPWDQMKRSMLEECLYWLLDSMGAKDLDWRTGGKGEGAADAGRDIEATFFQATPDGEMERQRWWVEAKGRTGTVSKSDVQNAVVNCQSRNDIDVLVVATNTQFSNPTKDWVREWQEKTPRPRVRLWDRHSLERMIQAHPNVAARLFPEALSDQGKLEALRYRFWNQMYFAGSHELKDIWRAKGTLDWDPHSLLAAAMGEVINGDISNRPWLAAFEEDEVADVLLAALANWPYFFAKSYRLGIDIDRFVKGLAYVALVAICRLPSDLTSKVLKDPWQFVDERDAPFPSSVHEAIVEPVLTRLLSELEDLCVADCARVSRDPLCLSDQELKRYWRRLEPTGHEGEDADDDRRVLCMTKTEVPCVVDGQLHCALEGIEPKRGSLSTYVDVLRAVAEKCRRPTQDG